MALFKGRKSGGPAARGRRSQLAAATVAALALAIMSACGGNGDGDGEEAPPSEAIAFGTLSGIDAGWSRERVIRRLGQEPILVAEPINEERAGGCIYYPIADAPLTDAWLYCFDENGGVNVSASLRTPLHPPVPEDASPARAVLIGRADAICESEYGHLTPITKRVGKALDRLDREDSNANRKAAAKQIAAFIDNLETTHATLAAFEAPEDELDALTAYLDALEAQIDVLGQARSALLAGDDERYDELGDEFNELASTAQENAEQYGFTTCGAATFK